MECTGFYLADPLSSLIRTLFVTMWHAYILTQTRHPANQLLPLNCILLFSLQKQVPLGIFIYYSLLYTKGEAG